jgi:tRNA (cytidine32/uridine32-2'-O)-methyltransferase|tara:strand:+ start:7039 stop:7863 length:825 start_codon:yes stop_codon:yes gene_type:complete
MQKSVDNLFPSVRIVLIETSHPGNIGAAARAMKNMGLTRLVLVNPKDFPDDKAFRRAASAVDVVSSAIVVDTLDEAIEGCQLVLGTSARDRRIPWPMLEPRACGEKVVAEQAAGAEIAIIFGRESRGLKNEELQKCHFHINIPTGEAYSSLNLAMAVQVLCYEVLQASLAVKHEVSSPEIGSPEISQRDVDNWDMAYATSDAVEHLFKHLEETLVQVEFHDPENPRQLLTRLRRMFNRIRLDEMEVNILRGFLTSVNKLGRPRPGLKSKGTIPD